MELAATFLNGEQEKSGQEFATESSRGVRLCLVTYRACIVCCLVLVAFMVGFYLLFDLILTEKEASIQLMTAFRNGGKLTTDDDSSHVWSGNKSSTSEQ